MPNRTTCGIAGAQASVLPSPASQIRPQSWGNQAFLRSVQDGFEFRSPCRRRTATNRCANFSQLGQVVGGHISILESRRKITKSKGCKRVRVGHPRPQIALRNGWPVIEDDVVTSSMIAIDRDRPWSYPRVKIPRQSRKGTKSGTRREEAERGQKKPCVTRCYARLYEVERRRIELPTCTLRTTGSKL